MRAVRLLLVCGMLLPSGGCFLSKQPTVQAPVAAPAPATPPPAPAPEQQRVATPVPAAAASAPPPSSPASVPATQPAKPSPFPSVPGTAPKPAPTPAPALGTLLTADQRKQLDTAYQSDMRQANAVLGRLAGRTLTTEQANTASRAREFIRQAGQFHDRDLTTAAELARRARVLTQDLAGTLK